MPTLRERRNDLHWARIARRHGFKNTRRIMQEARRAGISPALALAMIEQESGNGSNVFGHDRDHRGAYIFPARDGTVKVTRALYQAYRARRGPKGVGGMQGVGPAQLTWWELQDRADRWGGCWRPRINIRVAFLHLKALQRAHGYGDGIRAYNGSGPAAEAYRRSVLERRKKWHVRLFGK